MITFLFVPKVWKRVLFILQKSSDFPGGKLGLRWYNDGCTELQEAVMSWYNDGCTELQEAVMPGVKTVVR